MILSSWFYDVYVFICVLHLQLIDIGSIVSQRLAAMRKLRENPNDVCAQNEMYRAQNEVMHKTANRFVSICSFVLYGIL